MRTSDIARPLTAQALNENLYKQFNVKINFDKYNREQLENYRNLLRSKVQATETTANFNDLLTNETYQKDKYMLGVLNTKIKEMLGEGKKGAKPDFLDMDKDGNKKEPMKKAVADKKNSKQVDEISLQTMKSAREKLGGKALDAHGDDNKRAARDYAGRALSMSAKIKQKERASKQLDPDMEEGNAFGQAVRNAKKDGVQKGEKIKVGGKEYPVKEAGERTMSRAAKGNEKYGKDGMKALAKAGREGKDLDKVRDKYNKYDESAKTLKGGQKKLDTDKDGDIDAKDMKNLRSKKKVKESSELLHKAYQQFIAEGIANYIAEDEEGKAKSITAAADMVNDFTSWMQRVGNYQTKSMIELADNIRANFGMQEAEQFKQTVGSALEGALNSLTTAREEINNAVAVLAGEAPAVEPMGMEPDVGDTGMDDPGMEAGGPDEMNMPADEFGAADAAAGGETDTGRMKRESIERGNRLMKILGS